MSKMFKKFEFFLFLIIVALIVFFAFSTENFFTLENLLDLLISYSFLGIMAAGMLVVLISGGIDLSFTAIATVAQYIMAIIIIDYSGNLFSAFLVAGIVGIVLGGTNALLIYYLKAPAMIITIATLNLFYGVTIFITRGRWIYNFPDWFNQSHNVFSFTAADGTYYGIPLPVILLVLVFILTYIILKYTILGRKIFAMGGNIEAARRAGFNILGLTIFVYSYIGFLSGIGSVGQVLILHSVQPNAIVGRELEVIAATVLGGASLAGGAGSVLGTALGVALLAIVWNGLIIMGVSSYWHKLIIGLIIICSVGINAYNRKRNA
ncbi:MAG: ABC transporter permease [Candidatus Caldatribacteriota bacterium]|nr:ABC transporter permease [Candidatus Caldatribacteriota bacterium]